MPPVRQPQRGAENHEQQARTTANSAPSDLAPQVAQIQLSSSSTIRLQSKYLIAQNVSIFLFVYVRICTYARGMEPMLYCSQGER
jgi:hypothetical protein